MHEGTPHDDRFWNLVATYIDKRDLDELRRDWPVTMFTDIAIHVASCIPCLERRLVKLKTWRSHGPTADEMS